MFIEKQKGKVLGICIFSLFASSTSFAVGRIPEFFGDVNWKQVGIAAAGGAGIYALGVPATTFMYNRFFKREEVPQKSDLLPCVEIKDKHFEDFVGQSKIVSQVREFVALTKKFEACKKIGGKRPRGFLIEGEKSSGKTLLAKIIVSELDAQMIEVTKENFLSGDFGECFRLAFNFAKEKSKSKRTVLLMSGLEELNEKMDLLKELFDSLDETDDLIVLWEKEQKSRCDFSELFLSWSENDLWHLGMKKLYLFMPNKEDRIEILKSCLKGYEVEPSLLEEKSLARLADSWMGSFSFFKDLVTRVALYAVESESDKISLEHFNKVTMSLVGGLEENLSLKGEDLRRVAVHEAGHALIAYMSGEKVSHVSIVPHQNFLGVTIFSRDFTALRSKKNILQDVLIGLGGACAEELVNKDFSTGAMSDLMSVNSGLRSLVQNFGMMDGENQFILSEFMHSQEMKKTFDFEVIKLMNKCKVITQRILQDNRDKLDLLTDALMNSKTGTLYEDEIVSIWGESSDVTTDLLLSN